MTQQVINIDDLPNNDEIRISFSKCNDNFTELYEDVDELNGRIDRIPIASGGGGGGGGSSDGGSGTPGPPGPEGPAGPPGPQGDPGATGAAGAAGATGTQGPKGDQGDVGPQGATGATGAAGPAGLSGGQGPTGATGATGPQGDPGATGAQGPAGVVSASSPLSLTAGTLALDSSALNTTFNCGRLTLVSATALSFTPYNGDRIKIAGTVYAIPSAGIAGLTNSGLSTNTVYYVYAYNNSGTITGEFSATTHAVSTTAGNIGTEIKSGDNTRTLIGMARTNASSQFSDTTVYRWTISWFNRRNLELIGPNTGGASTVSTFAVILTTGSNINFLCWANEATALSVAGHSYSSLANSANGSNISVDGFIQLANGVVCNTSTVGNYGSNSGTIYATMTEGSHVASPMGYQVYGGTASFYLSLSAMIRG